MGAVGLRGFLQPLGGSRGHSEVMWVNLCLPGCSLCIKGAQETAWDSASLHGSGERTRAAGAGGKAVALQLHHSGPHPLPSPWVLLVLPKQHPHLLFHPMALRSCFA